MRIVLRVHLKLVGILDKKRSKHIVIIRFQLASLRVDHWRNKSPNGRYFIKYATPAVLGKGGSRSSEVGQAAAPNHGGVILRDGSCPSRGSSWNLWVCRECLEKLCPHPPPRRVVSVLCGVTPTIRQHTLIYILQSV